MSNQIKLEAGQWYRTLANQIVKCVHVHTPRGYMLVFRDGSCGYYPPDQAKEHLPDCTGFDWEPTKPVVAPEGWEIVTDGVCTSKDKILLASGEVSTIVPNGKIDGATVKDSLRFLEPIGAVAIIRKIEPKYRPFANAEEFKPYRDRWIKNGNTLRRVDHYSDAGVNGMTWESALRNRQFEDGTPFGVEVS